MSKSRWYATNAPQESKIYRKGNDVLRRCYICEKPISEKGYKCSIEPVYETSKLKAETLYFCPHHKYMVYFLAKTIKNAERLKKMKGENSNA